MPLRRANESSRVTCERGAHYRPETPKCNQPNRLRDRRREVDRRTELPDRGNGEPLVHDEVYFRSRDEKSVTRMWLPDRVRPIEAVSLVAVDHHDDQQERVVPDLIVGRDFVSGLVVPNPLRDPRWLEEWNRSGHELVDQDGLRGLEELDHLICSLGEFHLADHRTYAYTLGMSRPHVCRRGASFGLRALGVRRRSRRRCGEGHRATAIAMRAGRSVQDPGPMSACRRCR